MTTTTPTQALMRLRAGDKFTYNGKEFVVVKHRQTKTLIRNLADGKDYLLSQGAIVTKIGQDLDALSAAVNAQADRTPKLDIPVGAKVRIVDNERTRRSGIAGTETIVVRVNSKTYGLANDWRVTPGYVEVV
jgi:hypothetical protein